MPSTRNGLKQIQEYIAHMQPKGMTGLEAAMRVFRSASCFGGTMRRLEADMREGSRTEMILQVVIDHWADAGEPLRKTKRLVPQGDFERKISTALEEMH